MDLERDPIGELFAKQLMLRCYEVKDQSLRNTTVPRQFLSSLA